MRNKRKSYLFIPIGAICLAILIFALKLILDTPFRSGLPDIPDLQGIHAPLSEQISEAFKKAHKKPSSDNIGSLGMVYHSSAYYDKATQCYKLAARRNKSKWIWSYYLGYLNQEMGESETAIENFRNVIEKNPEAYHAWYYVGEGYRNLGSAYKAEVAFQKVANLKGRALPEKTTTRNDYFPLWTYAMFQLSRIYINSSRIDLAEQNLKQIIEARRSFGPAYRLLASLYLLKGDSVLSRNNIMRANDLADFSSPVDTLIDKLALLSRSELYILKQIDIAERSVYPEWGLLIATNGFKQLPDNKYLISKAIKLFLKLDLGNQALPYLDKHISLYRDDPDEINEIADLLYDKGFVSQSLIYYNLATKLSPDNAKAQSGLALCLSDEGMKENAISQITDFIERNLNNTEALKEVISFFIMVEERGKAALYLDRFRKLSTSDPEVKKFDGMIAEYDDRIQEAIALYGSSFKGNPSDLSTIRYLGNLYVKQKMWDKAIKHYRRALDFHPNEPDLLERTGTLLVSCPVVNLRDYKAAREFSERAFIHTGSPAEVLISSANSLAEAYIALGDKKNAVSFMNIAVSLARNQNTPKEYIAELEKKLKIFSSLK